MFNLIIADTEIERAPQEIAKHRIIQWQARRRGRRPTELLLNSDLHHPVMRRLQDGDRRGRPDIAHMCLLLALDSPLNREGLLRVYVHTKHDRVITVNPSTRLPGNLYRFEGLLEQLFLTGKSPPENPLLVLEDKSLAEMVKILHPKKVITFSDRDKPKLIGESYADLIKEDDICVIVGGFPKGVFLSDAMGISDEVVSIDPEPLHTPTVIARAIYAYEEKLGISNIRLGRIKCQNEETENMPLN